MMEITEHAEMEAKVDEGRGAEKRTDLEQGDGMVGGERTAELPAHGTYPSPSWFPMFASLLYLLLALLCHGASLLSFPTLLTS